MATRIYPITNTPRNLEILAGVPEGTHAKLAEWEAANPEPNYMDQEASYERWQKLQAIEEFAQLDHFKTFGWGRVDHRHPAVGMDGYSGELTGQVAKEFLLHHHIRLSNEQLAVLDGVCWG